jgi:putative sugar O-methyltransferase
MQKPTTVPPSKPALSERIKARTADGAAAFLALCLRPFGANTYRDVVNALWERQPVYSGFDIRLHTPEHVTPDESERPVVERVFAAYQKAKQDEAQQDSLFLPAGGWKNVLDAAYSSLTEGLRDNDLDRFHYFLANFGAWEVPTGIEQSSLFSRLQASARKRQHYEQQKIAPLIQWWETFESNGRGLDTLTIPRFGNQGGAWVNGHLVLANSVFSEVHSRLLAGFVEEQQQPVIGELGGGFGRLSYFLRKQVPQSIYLGLDLPECLACASYYLMLSFPDKKFLLYGEGELSVESLSQFDFVLRPSFEITRLPDSCIDLFVNENSLGMVPPEGCRLFVREICRISRAFWHRNHEVQRNAADDGTVGTQTLLNREYPVDRDRFCQVARYCDVARLASHDRSKVKSDMYWYYFRRKDD